MSDSYDAGLLNDWGGGNVEWWQDYIRAELGRSHEFYAAEIADLRRQLAERDYLINVAGDYAAKLERQLAEARGKALEEACEVVESNFPGTLYASNRTKTLTKIRALKGDALTPKGDTP